MTPFVELEPVKAFVPKARGNEEALMRLVIEPKRAPKNHIRRIAAIVAAVFECRLDSLFTRRVTKVITPAKFAAYYIAATETEHSFPEIGRVYKKDPSTIMHGKKKCEERMEESQRYADRVQKAIDEYRRIR